MIYGIGIDIIEINRIKESINKFGDIFLNKIFTKEEIYYCKNKKNPYQHFAGRFAAKEAVFKALGGITNPDLNWKNIEILNDFSGKPKLVFSTDLIKFLLKKNILLYHLSISHSVKHAVAQVILETGEKNKRKKS
ncbi:MAG: holo-ACP synthase [Candidatus Firestonebacteria bacterium]|nr:holo-ACP synthase [Candidatus Firestonebacteria bacterium]